MRSFYKTTLLLLIATTSGAFASRARDEVKYIPSKDGTVIRAQANGNPKGSHVIFAPGLGCMLEVFDPLFEDEMLLQNLYMVRYDTRGHGFSGKPLTPDFYTSDRYVDDIKAVIEGFGLVKPFFAGWSIGGAIAADITANFPDPLPFSGIIWLSAIPYLGDILYEVSTTFATTTSPQLASSDISVILQSRIDFAQPLSAKGDLVPAATQLAWLGGLTHFPPPVAALVLSRTQDPTRLLTLGAAGLPLLILHGSEDAYINGTTLLNKITPQFSNVENHLIPSAGHIIFYDAENAVARYILDFTLRIKHTETHS